jgi:uncharacterized membrane protein YccC
LTNKVDKKALKRAFWSSLARLIGVGLGAGAGSLLHQLIGGGFSGWGLAAVMAILSFGLMCFAEYEREIEQ